MTNIDTFKNAAKTLLKFRWVPHIRVAVPALTRTCRKVKQVKTPVSRLERDDLMELFQSDLSKMASLARGEKQAKVVPMRRPLMRPFNRAA